MVNGDQGFCSGASLLNSKNSSKGRGFKPWLGSADENPKRSKHPSTHSGLPVELIYRSMGSNSRTISFSCQWLTLCSICLLTQGRKFNYGEEVKTGKRGGRESLLSSRVLLIFSLAKRPKLRLESKRKPTRETVDKPVETYHETMALRSAMHTAACSFCRAQPMPTFNSRTINHLRSPTGSSCQTFFIRTTY